MHLELNDADIFFWWDGILTKKERRELSCIPINTRDILLLNYKGSDDIIEKVLEEWFGR